MIPVNSCLKSIKTLYDTTITTIQKNIKVSKFQLRHGSFFGMSGL